MEGDRANILLVLNILKEYSDENHIINAADIIDYAYRLYDKKIDRRTVYNSIEALNSIGYDISVFEENRKGYFLRERDFEPAEVRLLIDAAYSFKYISQRQTSDIVEKLKKLLNVYDRKSVNSTNIVTPDKKSLNQQVILNTGIISEAISAKKKISFTYLRYDYDKKLKPRRDEAYVVNPYGMICENEHYYLVCVYRGQKDVSLYRIDMMKDIVVLDEKVDISSRNINLNSVKKITYAYAGEAQTIRLRCDATALGYVIEKFGPDVSIFKDVSGDGSFEAVFSAAPNGIVFWALQYLQHVEVLSPKSLRDAVIECVKANKYGV